MASNCLTTELQSPNSAGEMRETLKVCNPVNARLFSQGLTQASPRPSSLVHKCSHGMLAQTTTDNDDSDLSDHSRPANLLSSFVLNSAFSSISLHTRDKVNALLDDKRVKETSYNSSVLSTGRLSSPSSSVTHSKRINSRKNGDFSRTLHKISPPSLKTTRRAGYHKKRLDYRNTDTNIVTGQVVYRSTESKSCNKVHNGLLLFLAMAAFVNIGGGDKNTHTVVNISADKQMAWIELAGLECQQEMLRTPLPSPNVTMCPRTWDSVLCWPDTKAGEVATQPCPSYMNGFQPWENATRRCMEDGTWYFYPKLNRTWTNLTQCLSDLIPEESGAEFIKSHMGRIRLMYSWGYGLSLASLVLSVIIMLSFRRLHCPRNTIHLNLFMSFILRAAISFMKEKLLVAGLGFHFDVERDEEQERFIFKNGSIHWECKLFFTCFNYILGANYMWILVEGLYLCTLVSWAVFSEKSFIKLYIIFGWLSPLWFVIPWVIVRALKEDVYCWNTHPTEGYFWIMRGPIVASILINFGIFVYIIVILCQKLSAVNSPEAMKFRYRKLARSTLVLIPLFGVHYMVFIFLPKDVHPTTQLVQLYFEMFFNSIQGFLVAVLFCFMNGEVRNELKKKWHRFRLTYLNQVIQSRTTDSCTHTSATFLPRAAADSKWSGLRSQNQAGRGGGGDRRGRWRQNGCDENHQESATMLLPMGQLSSNNSSRQENGTLAEVSSHSDVLNKSDAHEEFR
ncbi:parathyroid hormone/parathyroid hormone-related peptide receptor [Plakobranchus ocellatus]|uniref:Parathyroid hormone/parathyroid hormone-related peptide receptor n=1 Tax=Plakobranchus ocellatus TaxID=259542 RepID=A0AAV4B8H8_9GAST|nr:parathyroid hormone/parathyroid hormone-related peptide receptor [Plakobranchus ocellatus]